MTSSSSRPRERALDTVILVSSLLRGHPAEIACEQFIRARSGWFTSVLTLFEAKAILTKVYQVSAVDATHRLTAVASGLLEILALDDVGVQAALATADGIGVDFTDAVLLHTAREIGAGWLATDDENLARACPAFGLTPENPLDAALRHQVAAWEATHLPAKGLPRILRRVHAWLIGSYPQAAQDFWNHTGGASHLP